MLQYVALIEEIVFLLIPLIFIGVGILVGRKLKWQFSLSKIVIFVVSALLSAVIAAVISNMTAHIICQELVEMGVFKQYVDLMEEVATVEEVLCAFASMIVAPILYMPLFAIIRGILGFVNRVFLTKLYIKKDEDEESRLRAKNKKKNYLGMGLGALCGIVLCVAIMLPTVGALSVAGKMSHIVADSIEDAETAETVEAITDAAEINPTSVLVTAFGGKAVYNFMTTYDVLGTKVTLAKEAELLGAIEGMVLSIADENASNEHRAEAVREFSDAFAKSDAFPMLVVDIIETAQHDWDEGKTFCDIPKPSFGEDHESITDIFVACIERSSFETVKEDVDDVAEVLAIVIENDGWESIKNDPVHFIEDEDITSKILEVCLENDRMYPAIDDICDFGVFELFESFGAYESKEEAYLELLEEVKAASALEGYAVNSAVAASIRKHGLEYDASFVANADLAELNETGLLDWLSDNIVASEEDFASKTSIVTSNEITEGTAELTAPHAESLALAHVLSTVVDLIDHMEDPEKSTSDIVKDLGPVLDATAATETFGFEKTGLFLKGILQSEKVYSEVGFTMLEATTIADKIVSGAKVNGFTPMLLSLGQIVDVASAASSTTNIKDKVDVLVGTLTPETAEVISSVMTPDTLKNYGVSEDSAQIASDLLSNMLTNLSEAKDSMDEDTLAKETAAVQDIVNIMMDSSGTGSTFGTDGTMGADVDKYVDNILDSKVVTDTIVDAVYGDSDTPTVDPLNTGRELSDEELDNVEDYLNDKWSSMSDEEKQAMDLEKVMVSIGAMINANVTISGGEVKVTG